WKARDYGANIKPNFVTADGTKGGAPLDDPADGQAFSVGDVITWDLTAADATNSTHNQPRHPSQASKPGCVANLVFNLQLEDGSGTIIPIGSGSDSTTGWYSAINDGTGGDPVAAAAFALSYEIFSGWGPARAIDQAMDTSPPNGGPN